MYLADGLPLAEYLCQVLCAQHISECGGGQQAGGVAAMERDGTNKDLFFLHSYPVSFHALQKIHRPSSFRSSFF